MTRRPRSAGYEVIAPAQPMRRLEQDALSPADVLGRIADPVVIAGHSYAGAVISHPEVAAAGNVVGLARRPVSRPAEVTGLIPQAARPVSSSTASL